jgi:tRNA nucleotidyltransferase (CCA-adding enzyme)
LWRKLKYADAPPVVPEADYERMLDSFDRLVQHERERAQGSVYGRLAVNGEDLKELGVPEGRFLGRILAALRETVLDNPDANTRDFLLAEARRLLVETPDEPEKGQG